VQGGLKLVEELAAASALAARCAASSAQHLRMQREVGGRQARARRGQLAAPQGTRGGARLGAAASSTARPGARARLARGPRERYRPTSIKSRPTAYAWPAGLPTREQACQHGRAGRQPNSSCTWAKEAASTSSAENRSRQFTVVTTREPSESFSFLSHLLINYLLSCLS